MLAADGEATAQQAVSLVTDTRVQHFYDGSRRAGTAIAASVGWTPDIAWDIYLFYRPGLGWATAPPAPTAWMHQLRERSADVAHFYRGPALPPRLRTTLEQLLRAAE